MENLGLSKKLKKEIKEYFVNTFSRMNQQKELNTFLNEISPSLKLQIQYQIFHVALESNIVFNSQEHDEHGGDSHRQNPHGNALVEHSVEDDHNSSHSILNQLIKRLDVQLATPEQMFVNQDDELTEGNDYMYFLAKGDCVVLIKDRVFDGHEEVKHRSLLPGDHFGVS